MLCFCMGYTHDEVEKLILEGGYLTVADFQDDTFVGTGCGRCLPMVDDIFSKRGNADSSPEE